MKKKKEKKRREYVPCMLRRRKEGERYELWTLGFIGFNGKFEAMKGPFRTEVHALEMPGKTKYLIQHLHPDGTTTFDWMWKKSRWIETKGHEKNTKAKRTKESGFNRTK